MRAHALIVAFIGASSKCFVDAFSTPQIVTRQPYGAREKITSSSFCGSQAAPWGGPAYTAPSTSFALDSSSQKEVEALTEDKVPTPSASQLEPQVMTSGYSQDMDLVTALQQAVSMAVEGVPKSSKSVNLALVSVSSLYDGSASPSAVVPAVLTAVRSFGLEVDHMVGSTNGGYISSQLNKRFSFKDKSQKIVFGDDVESDDESDNEEKQIKQQACEPTDQEGVPGVSVVLCVFPDVHLKTFHVSGNNIPEDTKAASADEWQSIIGLNNFETDKEGNSAVFLLPSPAFQPDLGDLLEGISKSLGENDAVTVFGAAASTVSSLSRARLFRHDAQDPGCINTLADGCVGVAMSGDIQVETMMAQGAKPVGGVYRVVKGKDSTIQSIALDEAATELAAVEEENEGDDEDNEEDAAAQDKKAVMAAAYAKARIPKPTLAEANFIMRTLSDDDKAFMSKVLLVGIESKKGVGAWSAGTELDHLASGKGYRFEVHQVASAGVKDGSVTMSLDTVKIEPGMRLRFFVRDSDFAKREVEAMWRGYKRHTMTGSKDKRTPTGCFLFPTLDRGSNFFMGKPGFESSYLSAYLPSIPCVSGFFSNGVIGNLQMEGFNGSTRLHGSGTGYVLLSSKSERPFYSFAAEQKEEKSQEGTTDTSSESDLASLPDGKTKAPRDERGELVLKRREIHSGRAMTVSTVEWSVAEKTASPTSVLEGFMWDKEAETDRFRERVPLVNLVSQCRLSSADPSKPKPRDWIGPVKEAAAKGQFVIIPECKRTDPVSGSLRKRYDLSKIVREFKAVEVPAISVNCDAVMFGGSLEDVTKVREISSSGDESSAPSILASDLLLYPYQLYKLRLAGADAVNLIVAALAAKDLTYLAKIASSLNLQTLVTVTSVAQIEALDVVPAGGVDGMIISNRELEDFSFDMTGQQALDVLRSNELAKFREKHGKDFPVFCEGRIGLIERKDSSGTVSSLNYLKDLKEAGAIGAIIGSGLVKTDSSDPSPINVLTSADV